MHMENNMDCWYRSRSLTCGCRGAGRGTVAAATRVAAEAAGRRT